MESRSKQVILNMEFDPCWLESEEVLGPPTSWRKLYTDASSSASTTIKELIEVRQQVGGVWCDEQIELFNLKIREIQNIFEYRLENQYWLFRNLVQFGLIISKTKKSWSDCSTEDTIEIQIAAKKAEELFHLLTEKELYVFQYLTPVFLGFLENRLNLDLKFDFDYEINQLFEAKQEFDKTLIPKVVDVCEGQSLQELNIFKNDI